MEYLYDLLTVAACCKSGLIEVAVSCCGQKRFHCTRILQDILLIESDLKSVFLCFPAATLILILTNTSIYLYQLEESNIKIFFTVGIRHALCSLANLLGNCRNCNSFIIIFICAV